MSAKRLKGIWQQCTRQSKLNKAKDKEHQSWRDITVKWGITHKVLYGWRAIVSTTNARGSGSPSYTDF